jgi:hypothetical protein
MEKLGRESRPLLCPAGYRAGLVAIGIPLPVSKLESARHDYESTLVLVVWNVECLRKSKKEKGVCEFLGDLRMGCCSC